MNIIPMKSTQDRNTLEADDLGDDEFTSVDGYNKVSERKVALTWSYECRFACSM